MIYRLMKRIIDGKSYDAAELLEKLDVYFMFGRISQAEYEELVSMLRPAQA